MVLVLTLDALAIEPEVGKITPLKHRARVMSWLPQFTFPMFPLVPIYQPARIGRMNNQVGWSITAKAKIQTQTHDW